MHGPVSGCRTLDNQTRTLADDMLVIADAERAQAIGGVMGGGDSEVSSTTTRIVFEAAWFKPQSVRATSRKLGLRTEASMRFERGADLTAPATAMARAAELLQQLGAGAITAPFIDAYPTLHQPATLFLAQPRIAGLLGMAVPDDEVPRILTALGFTVAATKGGWRVTVPGWRVDVHRDVDLIEELGRHHGFEHLPATFPGVQQAPAPSDPRIARDARARRLALASGFSEAISFAFIEARHAEPFLGGDRPVALANPLSEKFAVMRPSLVPGLVDAVSHNRRHGRRDIQLFEIGTRFSPRGETRALALAWTGLATPDHWSGNRRDADFFDLSGVAEQLGSLFGATLDAVPPDEGTAAARVLVPGRAAAMRVGDDVVGWLGQLESAIADAHDVPAQDVVWVGEFDLDRLSGAAADAARFATPLPRFPSAGTRHRDARGRILVCSGGSWHHSIASARNAGQHRRVRSLPGQGHTGGEGQPGAPPHVPVARAHAHRRGGRSRHHGRRRTACLRTRRDPTVDCDTFETTCAGIDDSRPSGGIEVYVATKNAAGLEPIDRLEEKIKTLVSLIGRLKNEQARVMEDNTRLQRDLESLKARLADAEGTSAEATTLREERDLIRARVTEMLQQLDGLNL